MKKNYIYILPYASSGSHSQKLFTPKLKSDSFTTCTDEVISPSETPLIDDITEHTNVASLVYKTHEGTFLAALKTKTKKSDSSAV